MQTTPLMDHWQIIDTGPGAGDALAFSQPGLDTSAWFAVAVPGDVNATLVAAGRMPNPHYGDNARACYWVSGRDWWYRLEFAAPDAAGYPRAELCLDGLDGHEDLYLNGERLGRTENAFRPYRLDVTGKLRAGQPNVLLLRFEAIDSVMGGPRADELAGWGARRTLMRKPQFSFGWDWSLPLPSIGITGYVRLEQHSGARLLDVSVQTFVSGRLDFKFLVTSAARDAGYRLRLRVAGHDYEHEAIVERAGRVNSYTTLWVPNPQLWWPRGLGEQALYDYEVLLEVDGTVVDRRRGALGIREVRIVEEPFTPEAGPGISFWFEVNGQRVFCKGGNWIPQEIWPATATDEQYRFYLQRAAEADFNMLRIWGGGIYERDIFYDLCDQLGIMVWQDFMFASAGYPVDRLRDEIIAEAEYQIKRLRVRPSVVIWCGINEDVFSWSLPDEAAMASADTGVYSPPEDGARRRLHDDPQIYSMILRGLVSRHGLAVPYVESSPQSHDDAGNLPESGNCHISAWKYGLFGGQPAANLSFAERLRQGLVHAERFRGQFEQVCSFDSEFCIQGPCDVWTMQQFLPHEHRWPPDDLWTFHIQRGHANLPHHEQTIIFAEAICGPVDSLQKYVKYGQAVHAEMMRAEFESARRDRPNNGGTMMWMYNDCWPTSNWSIIDYYRRPKPSYYAARRACAQHLPIIFERAGQIEFFISNDGPAAIQADLRYGLAELDGTVAWEDSRSGVQVGACATTRFHALSKAGLQRGPGSHLFIDAVVDGHALSRVTYFPDMWREVPWPTPQIGVEIVGQERGPEGWLTTVEVSTDTYARFCHLRLPESARPFWLDDNFFDLSAGHRRRVHITSAQPIDAGMLTAGHWGTEWA